MKLEITQEDLKRKQNQCKEIVLNDDNYLLRDLVKEYGLDAKIFLEHDYDYSILKIVLERNETDEEYKKRIEKLQMLVDRNKIKLFNKIEKKQQELEELENAKSKAGL